MMVATNRVDAGKRNQQQQKQQQYLCRCFMKGEDNFIFSKEDQLPA
jgi:hypothetical protein